MLVENIFNDYKEAMKARDTLKSSVLSLLRAELLNTAIERKKKNLNDNDALGVIRKQIKQRQDSIEQFKIGNRQDLADKEAKELEILKSYLPKELSPAELEKIIDEVILSTGAIGLKGMGKVMKEVNARVLGRSDGRLVSDSVKARLSGAG